MRYLNYARTVFTYATRNGETAFGRCEIRAMQPEVIGFASASTARQIVEAVFVPSQWADLATGVIETGAHEFGIAVLLDAHAIPYRYPTGTGTALVVSLPSRSDDEAQQVA